MKCPHCGKETDFKLEGELREELGKVGETLRRFDAREGEDPFGIAFRDYLPPPDMPRKLGINLNGLGGKQWGRKKE